MLKLVLSDVILSTGINVFITLHPHLSVVIYLTEPGVITQGNRVGFLLLACVTAVKCAKDIVGDLVLTLLP